MATRFGTTVITSSMFDNENMILAVLIKINEVVGALVTIQESPNFSLELNQKISTIKAIFTKNIKMVDIVKVFKTNNNMRLGLFDKNFFMQSSNITKDQMIEYIKKEVFKSIVKLDVLEKISEKNVVAEEKQIFVEQIAPSIPSIQKEESVLLDNIEDESIDGDKDLEEDENFEQLKNKK